MIQIFLNRPMIVGQKEGPKAPVNQQQKSLYNPSGFRNDSNQGKTRYKCSLLYWPDDNRYKLNVLQISRNNFHEIWYIKNWRFMVCYNLNKPCLSRLYIPANTMIYRLKRGFDHQPLDYESNPLTTTPSRPSRVVLLKVSNQFQQECHTFVIQT